MSRHSAFRCKTPGCHTLLGVIVANGRIFKQADEIHASASAEGIVVVCPICGAARFWRNPTLANTDDAPAQTA